MCIVLVNSHLSPSTLALFSYYPLTKTYGECWIKDTMILTFMKETAIGLQSYQIRHKGSKAALVVITPLLLHQLLLSNFTPIQNTPLILRWAILFPTPLEMTTWSLVHLTGLSAKSLILSILDDQQMLISVHIKSF